MNAKRFSQEEVNRIVAARVKRERERLTKEFETVIKRSMASIHLILHQEMCAMKRDMTDEATEALFPATSVKFKLKYPDGTSHEFDAIPSVKMDAGTLNGALTFSVTMLLQSDIEMKPANA